MIKPIALAAMCAIGLSACHADKPITPPTIVVTGCEHFKLIAASRKDTDGTKEQVLAHNAEYLKVCGEH